MPPYEIISWEPNLSPHKIAFYQAVAADPRVARVVYVAAADLSGERRALGWTIGDTTGLEVIVAPDADQVRALAVAASPSAVHILCGMRGGLIDAVAPILVKARRYFGVMSEPRAHEGISGLMRWAHSLASERKLRRNAAFVLAIGRNGPRWFQRTGYRPEIIFPFAYFPPLKAAEKAGLDPTVAMVAYLGRLEPEKGVALMMDVRQRFGAETRFAFAGAGSMAQQVADAAGETLMFAGRLNMDATSDFLSRADVVCAPSTDSSDGWCAVVSEALAAGAAVVTTPMVGAAICIEQDPRLGRVVAPSVRAITDAIATLIAPANRQGQLRDWRSRWARARLSPAAGAATLLEILDHRLADAPRPRPFYERESDPEHA